MQRFAIVSNGRGWTIRANGDPGGAYLTREAAFEAVVGEASVALKAGEGIEIIVDEPRRDTRKGAVT